MPSVKKHEICSDPMNADPICPFPSAPKRWALGRASWALVAGWTWLAAGAPGARGRAANAAGPGAAAGSSAGAALSLYKI